jgi:hypothetical protein
MTIPFLSLPPTPVPLNPPQNVSADPQYVDYYLVKVGANLTYQNVDFQPGREYMVKPSVYFGVLNEDGDMFWQYCVHVMPHLKPTT